MSAEELYKAAIAAIEARFGSGSVLGADDEDALEEEE
jgi:hypothetical protein